MTTTERMRAQEAPTRRPSRAEEMAELLAMAIEVGALSDRTISAELASLAREAGIDLGGTP